MKRIWWEIRKKMRLLGRRISKWFASFFFPVTADSLKDTPYNLLPAPLDWNKIAKGRKVYVEIGSGHGEVLLANDKERSITIGYEIKSRFFRLSYRKSVRRSDVFVFKGSGYDSLFMHYKDNSVDRLFILFPDPWHKKKHAKRRPLVAEFFKNVAQKMKTGGEIIIASDWPEYVDFIRNETSQIALWYNVANREYSPSEFNLPITHYHQKWQRKGRSFTVFVLTKKA